MTDARVLLERHKPRLVYDALEAYFADSAAIWTDSPHNALRRADGTVLARPPKLRLEFLGPHAYADERPVLADDAIGETTRDYAAHAAALHREANYRDRVYGHARRDRDGRLWLQYWLFYYYNDFQLLGPLVSGGKHEGDWELVQFRLGPSEQPEQAVYTQHKLAESRPWTDVRKARRQHADRLRRPRLARELLPHRLALDRRVVRPGRRARAADHAHARGLEDRDARLGALAGLVGGHEGDRVAAGLRQPAQPGPAAALERPGAARHAAAPAGAPPRPRCGRRRHRADRPARGRSRDREGRGARAVVVGARGETRRGVDARADGGELREEPRRGHVDDATAGARSGSACAVSARRPMPVLGQRPNPCPASPPRSR